MNDRTSISSEPAAEPVAGTADIFEFFQKKVQWHFRYKFGTSYVDEALKDDILRQLAKVPNSQLDRGGFCLETRMINGNRPSEVEPVEEEELFEIWIGSRPFSMSVAQYRAALKECIVDGFVGWPYEHLRNVVQIETMSTPVFTEKTFHVARCPEFEQTLRDVMSPKVPRQWRGHESELLFRLQIALTDDDPLVLRRLGLDALLAYIDLFEDETEELREIINDKPGGTMPCRKIPIPAGADPKVWQSILDGKNRHFAVLGGRTVLLADTETIGRLYGFMFRYYPRYGLGGRALVMKTDNSWDEPPVYGEFLRQFDLAGFDLETGKFTINGEVADAMTMFSGIKRGVIRKTPWDKQAEEIEREIAKDIAREKRARKAGIEEDWYWP